MINLIPKEEKKRMTIDFYYRLAILFLAIINFTILVTSIAILPAYFISSEKDREVNSKLEIQKNDNSSLSGEQAVAVIKDMNSKLDLIEKAEKNNFLVSLKVVNAIILNKIPNIKIIQILYANDPTLGKTISIIGMASSREVLLLFRQKLEDNPNFKNINLPISSFVKDSNIQFNLSLIPS